MKFHKKLHSPLPSCRPNASKRYLVPYVGDIVGGALLSAALVALYAAAVSHFNR